MIVDWLLIVGLGFLGSFGHCASMCGPLAIAFSLSGPSLRGWQSFYFHIALNLGRIISYLLVGAAIGGLGSVLVAGGQLAGVGSDLRQGMTWLAGSLLIWLGLCQLCPGWLPKIPLLHPLGQGPLHQQLTLTMTQLSAQRQWWTPVLLGMVWGLIPCGFLYTAQIKAAGTISPWGGALTLFAFGLGTLPTMVGVGVWAGLVTPTRRQQLFRLGGWLTLLIGLLTLTRTGEMSLDITGYGAMLCLILALVARPISRLWPLLLQSRRGLGLAAFALSLAHIFHSLDHTWSWQWRAWVFMLPQHQWGVAFGIAGLGLILPAAVTSFNWAQCQLGQRWRKLHLLCVPALLLCTAHCILTGTHFLGGVSLHPIHWIRTTLLLGGMLSVLIVRSRRGWALFSLGSFYSPPSPRP